MTQALAIWRDVSYKRTYTMPKMRSFLVGCAFVLGSGCGPSGSSASRSQPQAEHKALSDDSESVSKSKPESTHTLYGKPLMGESLVTIEQVMDEPAAYDGKVVRVEGMVTDVCTRRGCWFEMAGERPGMKMRFKVRDGDMVFPPSAKGKRAVAEGTVTVRTLSLEQTREFEAHMAEDAGKEFDAASVTEPMVIVQLDGRGAVIDKA